MEPGPALRDLQRVVLAQAPELQPSGVQHGFGAADVLPPVEQAGVLPGGVVTFLLTAIEGSTGLWEADGDAMATALELHDALIARLAARYGGATAQGQG